VVNKEQAESILINAAKNNPYFNDKSIRCLLDFANIKTMQTITKLLLLAKNEEEIKRFIGR
jgi:hypothetical protein